MKTKILIILVVLVVFGLLAAGGAQAQAPFGQRPRDTYLSKGTGVYGTGEETHKKDRNPVAELNWLRKKAADEEMERRRLDKELARTQAELEETQMRELRLAEEVESLKATVIKLNSMRSADGGGQLVTSYYIKEGFYEVQEDDSLWKIAARSDVFGDAYKWTELYYANKHKIDNPDMIYPGQVLKIPDYYAVEDMGSLFGENASAGQ